MKFEAIDKRYFRERERLSKQYGPRELWHTIDHWPLYAGVANIGRVMAVADLLRKTLDVPGDLAEFGTWRGSNLMFIAKLMRLYDPYGPKIVHCFDSFEGLTEFAREDGAADQMPGRYKGSLEELTDMINLYEFQDEVEIHKGLVEDTLPALVEANAALSFSFVYCDVDLYSGTTCILQQIHERLSKGGLFIFDEYNVGEYPGETVAVREFLAEHSDSYTMESVVGTRSPSMVIRKIKS